MAQTIYDPHAPLVVRFRTLATALLNPSQRGLLYNWPWPMAGDSPLERKLKRIWRSLRVLPEKPFTGGEM